MKLGSERRSSSLPKTSLQRILTVLDKSIPAAKVELNSKTPFELLIATILSAQCTDERVNIVTPSLFQRYPTAANYVNVKQSEIESIIRPTGFYRNKAKNIIGCAKVLHEQFGGVVPDTMDALTTLPGVGRKTANVLLGSYFGKPAVVVDTHVKRVANRLHLTTSQNPTDIEYDLQRKLPRSRWTNASQRLLLHGRYVCLARAPRCEQCVIYSDCPWEGKQRRA